jgi:IS1 family transposase
MNKLPVERRVAILRALTEGCSLRSISRMVAVSINTVTKLLIDAGQTCALLQHEMMRDLTCQRLQLDEIWGFVYTKDKNIPPELKDQSGVGSIWTWVAIDSDTKIVPSFLVGLRDGEHASVFVDDLAGRLAHRVQIMSDGLKAYLDAVDAAFGGEVHYAVLHKVYGAPRVDEARYSPAECQGCTIQTIKGNPDEVHNSTSHIERQNLTMRMRNRRLTRLTNGFSKKLENLEHSIALHFFVYNFITRHMTIRMPPALKAHVTDHVWTFAELVEKIDADEIERKARRQPN